MLHCRVDSPTKVTSRAYLPLWLALVPAYGGAPMVAPRILKLPTEDLFGQDVLRIFPPQGPRSISSVAPVFPSVRSDGLSHSESRVQTPPGSKENREKLPKATSFRFPQSQESACA